jgi:hypothetical protein
VHQTSYELLREMLRGALMAAVGSGHGDGGIGSTPGRASAALYALLGAHPVDQRGCCRSCRAMGTLPGRRRRVCRVLLAAWFYLYQPKDILPGLLASELHQHPTPPPSPEAAPEPGRAPGTILRNPDANESAHYTDGTLASPSDASSDLYCRTL